MFVSRRKEQKEQSTSKNITIDNMPLDNVDKYTYLGVDIDYNLSFYSMMDNIYKKKKLEIIHVEIDMTIYCKWYSVSYLQNLFTVDLRIRRHLSRQLHSVDN